MKLIKYLIVILLLIPLFAPDGYATEKVLTYTIASGTDDAGGYYANKGMFMPYYTTAVSTYVRWPITVPPNASIVSMYIDFKVKSSGTISAPITIDLVNSTDCPSFASTPVAFTGTPIETTLTGTWAIGNTVTTPDIKALLATYIALDGYATGKYMGIRLTRTSGSGTTQYVYTYEDAASRAAVLRINYTGGDVTCDLWMAEPYVRTKQYIYPRFLNQDAGDVIYVYLDDALIHTYTVQAGDVPASPATVFEKRFLMDYTGLTAGEHHIDVITKTSGGTTRGTTTKTWTTTHSGYPKVGINEDNAICLRNGEGDGCDLYFPILSFMYDMAKFYPTMGDPFSYALNGIAGEGTRYVHAPISSKDFLDASTTKGWLSFMALTGEYETIRANVSVGLDTVNSPTRYQYKLPPVQNIIDEPNGHYYKCTDAGYTWSPLLSYDTATKTKVTHIDFHYTIGSTEYTKAANTTGIALPAGTIPQNKYGIYRLSIIADGTVTITAGANNAAGYDDLSTTALQSAALPALPENSYDMGYVFVKSTESGGFVAGTSLLDTWAKYASFPQFCTTSGCTTWYGTTQWTEQGTCTPSTCRTESLASASSDCTDPESSFTCSYVNQLKTHASILGWLWEDEPSMGGPSVWKAPNPYIRNNYTAVKAADTDHPHILGHYGYEFAPNTNSPSLTAYSWLTNASLFSGEKTWLMDIITGDAYPYGFIPADGKSVLVIANVPVTMENTLGMDDNWTTYSYGLIPHFTVPCPQDVGHYACSHVEAAGSGYTTAVGLATTGGSGTGMTITLTYSTGAIRADGWKIENMGTGYLPGDIVTVVQGANATGSIHIARLTPTGPQLKNELWTRTIHGAKGMEYFHYFCPQHAYQINEAVNYKNLLEGGEVPLANVLLQPKSSKYTPETSTVFVSGIGNVTVSLDHATTTAGSDGRVDYMIREYGGETWVFAARVKKRSYEDFESCSEVCFTDGYEKMTIAVAPSGAGWSVGDTITGLTSGTTCKIEEVTTPTTYLISTRSGEFARSEILTNGTVTSNPGATPYPLITANGAWPDTTNTNTKSATIPVTGLAASTTVTVYGEARTITSGDGTITDNFTDYDVHIYRMGTEIGADTTAPTVTAFAILPTSSSLTVSIPTFTCYDATGVTGYCVTTTNSSSGCSWSATAPTSVTFASDGAQTAYGWCKDVVPNTSTAATSATTIDTSVDYALTVTLAGTGGGTVESSPAGINCGSVCVAEYAEDTEVTLTARPISGSSFTGWSGTGGCTGTSTCVLTMAAAKEATATFTVDAQTEYDVTLSFAGTGSGTTDPGITVFSRTAGDPINVTQTPNISSTFAGWSGTCGCTGTGDCTTPMPASNCTVIATWNDCTRHTLTVTAGDGVGVTSDNLNCSTGVGADVCSYSYCENYVVPLSSACDEYWYGLAYTGDCTGADCTLTMSEDKDVGVSCLDGREGGIGSGGTMTLGSGGTVTFGRTDTPEVRKMGTENTEGISISLISNRADCWSVQAPISGTLTTAYVAHANTSAATAKVCVYSNDGDAPDGGDSKIGCSGAITSDVVEVKTASMDGGSVTAGSYYYMCTFIDNDSANAFNIDTSSATSTVYYKTNSGLYDTPGDTLSGGWNSAAGQRIKSVYVTITP